jgi:hypothetical protein
MGSVRFQDLFAFCQPITAQALVAAVDSPAAPPFLDQSAVDDNETQQSGLWGFLTASAAGPLRNMPPLHQS